MLLTSGPTSQHPSWDFPFSLTKTTLLPVAIAEKWPDEMPGIPCATDAEPANTNTVAEKILNPN